MSVTAYCNHMAGDRRPDVHELLHGHVVQKPYQPLAPDVVEFDGLEVTEGPVAEESHRIYVSQQERADLQRALVLTP